MAKVIEKIGSYDFFKWDTLVDGIDIFKIKPSGYLKFMNFSMALHGKLPNRFQRWMLKKVFGFEIVEENKNGKGN